MYVYSNFNIIYYHIITITIISYISLWYNIILYRFLQLQMEFSKAFETSFREAFGAGLSPPVLNKILDDVIGKSSSDASFDTCVQQAIDEALNLVMFEDITDLKWHAVTSQPADEFSLNHTDPSVSSCCSSVLSLLMDEDQLSAFNSLRAILPTEVEDSYLLDTLMTYNFNVNDTISVIFEEKGQAEASCGSTEAGRNSLTCKGKKKGKRMYLKSSFTLDPVTNRPNIVIPPRVIESIQGKFSTPTYQQILTLDPFQWMHSGADSREALATFLSMNPDADVKIDSTSCQLVYCGTRGKTMSESSRNEIILDFHHSTVKVALEITRSAMIYYADKKRCGDSVPLIRTSLLHLLFGLGNHSYSGRCVLQIAVCSYLDRRGIPHEKSCDRASTVVKI